MPKLKTLKCDIFGIFKHCGFSRIENHSKYLLRGNLTNYCSFHNFQLGHIFVMLQYLKDKRVNRSMTYEAKPFWKSTDNWNFYGLSQCLKIIKKSHLTMRAKRVFILSGQKFVKNAKIVNFWECLKT